MFLEGFRQFLLKEKPPGASVELRFFGIESQPQAKERLLNYDKDLRGFIVPEPSIPYSELVKKLRASHILLLLSKKGADWLNAKIYDYIGVKRKILLVENDSGIMEKLLADTGSGVAANTAGEVCEILTVEYENFRKGNIGEIKPATQTQQYSRRYQADILAQLLKKI
jgi:hypothetical protein